MRLTKIEGAVVTGGFPIDFTSFEHQSRTIGLRENVVVGDSDFHYRAFIKPGDSVTWGGALKAKGPVIIELPLEQIRRPLLRTRNNDPEKVKELMASIADIGLQEPIDVLEVEGFYYGFSGCHRYEAHQRLGLPTIRCKVRRGTKDTLRHHLR
ncbi:hypothetical protein AXG93_948s1510 [Marchantia polymorpha subsp. ruderalis]|uniref:sulfiredoxin n=1 Tax=Marchantia polymorpha subsp. ruderalis TaxID=1480154 RepID=A0A176VJE9_MARPO|nr:hypothetical protein AXG93_948s1510 [Marchantia polymorpha subsp. ruderalis]